MALVCIFLQNLTCEFFIRLIIGEFRNFANSLKYTDRVFFFKLLFTKNQKSFIGRKIAENAENQNYSIKCFIFIIIILQLVVLHYAISL